MDSRASMEPQLLEMKYSLQHRILFGDENNMQRKEVVAFRKGYDAAVPGSRSAKDSFVAVSGRFLGIFHIMHLLTNKCSLFLISASHLPQF